MDTKAKFEKLEKAGAFKLRAFYIAAGSAVLAVAFIFYSGFANINPITSSILGIPWIAVLWIVIAAGVTSLVVMGAGRVWEARMEKLITPEERADRLISEGVMKSERREAYIAFLRSRAS